MNSFVTLKDVYKRYQMGEVTITASDGVSFEINKGEFAVVVGSSGAGKTTILNILGGMDSCDEGTILVDGKDIAKYNDKQLTEYRRFDIGFVFQFYNLVPNLTAKENVELATQISKDSLNPAEVLKEVGLGDRLDNFPAQLSGGEAATGFHRKSACQTPQAAALRRADRRPGLQYRQDHLKAIAGYLPKQQHDRSADYSQSGNHADG